MSDILDLQIASPTFGGSTGGWLRAAEVEEKYAITWISTKEQIFEMPTGGAAIMRNGENLLYLARKEQCLAFLKDCWVNYLQSILDTISDFKSPTYT